MDTISDAPTAPEADCSSYSRCRSREWAMERQLGAILTLVLWLTFAFRLGKLLPTNPAAPALLASLLGYCAGCGAVVAWRYSGWRSGSFERWREPLALLLRLTGSGLGAWAVLTGQMLDALPATAASGIVSHLALMVFASGGPSCIHSALAWRMRFWLSMPTQAFLVWTIARQHTSYCTAPALANPTARLHTHRLYSLLSVQAYSLPLPLSAFVEPSPEAECATVLTWLQVTLGLLAPLLSEALAEARLFRQSQRRRAALGLPCERGVNASALSAVGFLVEEGNLLTTPAVAWLALAATWDWVALFSIPPDQRGAPPLT